MAMTLTDIERITEWCDACSELEAARLAARNAFFGADEDGPVDYLPDAGDYRSRQRRFLGWFMFQPTLPGGERPSAVAARRLFQGEQQDAVLRAVAQARYVMAVVAAVIPGRGALLELEDERFEVRSRTWGQVMQRTTPVLAHLVPSRPGVWLPGPGWLEWPASVGPNMRRELRKYQPDPIEVERVLQGRSRNQASDIERPRDATLADAVARMTEAATSEGRRGLVRTEADWEALVLRHLNNPDVTAFAREVITRIGDVDDVRELNRWMALAQNIWNATPQPDRGGLSAYELASRSSRRELELDSWHD